MTVKGGPKIVSDGLVFNLDAAGAVSDKGYDPEGLTIEYLIVAGGGGGSGWGDGVGGGAGGFLLDSTKLTSGTYTVTIGAGGGRGTNSSGSRGSNGGDSQIGDSLIAYGGGGAGCKNIQDGLAGGSGGGGYGNNNVPHGVGGSGVPGQGNDGGDGINYYRGGGGGGAGAAGTPGTSAPTSGLSKVPGGIGRVAKIDFNWQYYAGGGGVGGCCSRGDGSGGLGGGGSGGDTNTDGVAGTANTGGGGGGGGSYFNRATFGGNGGSGIVMIRYRGKQKATGGDSIVYKNGYTIHTFTSSGSFVLSESLDGLSTSKIVGTLNNMGSSNYNSGNKGYFNFNTDEYIDCSAYADNLIFSSPATISCWFMPLHDKNTGSVLFSMSNDVAVGTTGSYAFIFRYGNVTGTIPAETFCVHNYNGSNSQTQATFYGIANGYDYQNQWVNAVCVVENNTWKVYVNGSLQTLTKSTYWNGSLFTFGDHIASKDNVRIVTAGSNINMASFQIYNIGLSADQILDNYNATKGRFGL
jgi:hypothetical protein